MNLCEVIGKTLVDQLVQHKITDFSLSPGYRSSPLAVAVAENPLVNVQIHFDERGAAFYALGTAKATGKPSVIIVTSGTAVGNLMPAVMEASKAQIPLILLTCDRPHELRNTEANQTTDQVKIFGEYTRFHFDFPRPSHDLPPRFIATTIAEGVYKSLFPLPGPVHFNLPFPEPFIGKQKAQALKLTPVILDTPKIQSSQKIDLRGKKGIIAVGRGGGSLAVKNLSQKLNWPVFADIASGYREIEDPRSISHYHHILNSLSDLEVDTIVHVGGPFVSKVFLNWMAKQPEIIHVCPYFKRVDPQHKVSIRTASCDSIVGKTSDDWVKQWLKFSEKAAPSWDYLCEPAVVDTLTGCSDALFFANSMPIRDADMFFFPKSRKRPIFANRGLSGIDGNIATVCGIASKMPVTAILGDQTTLHDLNSLALINQTKYPVRLIIINNKGGGIFSFLEMEGRGNLTESHFAAAHDFDFEKIAQSFKIRYDLVDNLEKLKSSKATMIEVITSRVDNHELHKKIDTHIQTRLCDSFFTAF